MRLAVLLLLAGCATARDGAVVTTNAAGAFLADAEKALASLDKADQQAVIDHGGTADGMRAELAAVRARYHGAWVAYRKARAGWLVAASVLRAYDDAERARLTHAEGDYAKAVADLVAAEAAFAHATAALREAP